MDWYSEEILKIAFDDSGDLIIDGDRHHVVQRARLKVDTVKWIMAKLAPKKYGDKPVDVAPTQAIAFQWLSAPTPVEPPSEPPRQIEYHKPEMPADLFREGRSSPDLSCSVEWGAAHSVSESGTPRFVKYREFDIGAMAEAAE